jgi:spore germination protein GerM
VRRVDIFIGAGLGALLVGVTLTAPRWSRWLRQPVAPTTDPALSPDAATDAATEPDVEPEPTAAPAEVQRTINVKLLFEDPASGALVPEERSVIYHANLARQLRVVVEELLRGSQSGRKAPLPAETHVREVFVTARGIAYVDVSKEIAEKPLPGADAEMLAVFSLVNSITMNFPAVKRVQILIEGRVAETLAGHVDLSRPLLPDVTLLASSRVEPPAPAKDVPPS